MAAPSWWNSPNKNQVIIFVAFIANMVVTYLSNTGAYGCTNKGVSDEYFTLITPPGWAFAIWGVIFMWQGIACVAQAEPKVTAALAEPFTSSTMFVILWCLVCGAQCLWSVMFCQSVYVASALLILIWIFLLSLQMCALRICVTNDKAVARYLLCVAPFSIHLGWITAASTLNVNLAAVAANSSPETLLAIGIGSVAWVAVIACVFGIVATPITKNYSDIVFVAGVIWALYAVAHRDVDTPIKTNEGPKVYDTLITGSLTSAVKFVYAMLIVCLALRYGVQAGIKFLPGTPTNVPVPAKQTQTAQDISTPLMPTQVGQVVIDPQTV